MYAICFDCEREFRSLGIVVEHRMSFPNHDVQEAK